MDIFEASIMYHITLVLLLLWVSVSLGWSHPLLFFSAFFYLYKVADGYSLRLRRRLLNEEKKCAEQRRLLSERETVRWLNHAVEKIWPICMEQMVSQQFLLPVVPWFLDKFKPWTAEKAVMQHLYLGRNPPIFTEMRVVHESADDDHLVLELGMNFLTAEDMSAILAVQLRKSMGFGMTINMHVTSMHVEGKVLVGIKFIRHWPFLGRLRICFVEPPYFQMAVKPIFNCGIDVTELPGISGWLDNLLDAAFGQTLVEPNMLVVDVEKFVTTPTEGWFSVDEKPPVAYVRLEILEGAEMKPSDLNGLADPYVKGQLGQYRFRTKIQRKTLTPKWLEEFMIPISSWEAPNVLALQVRDKDPMFDDLLGDCSIHINELRDGQRHDKWISLKNIKMGRLHLAVTVLKNEPEKEEKDLSKDEEICGKNETVAPISSYIDDKNNTDQSLKGSPKSKDEYEPINIEGQEKIGIWVHRPGSGASQTWEPRKGRARHPETKVEQGPTSPTFGFHTLSNNDNPSESKSDKSGNAQKGIRNLGSMFRRNSKKDGSMEDLDKSTSSPRPDEESFVVGSKEENESLGTEKETDVADQQSKPAKGLKNLFSRKGSNKSAEGHSSHDADKDSSHRSNLSDEPQDDDPFLLKSLPIDASIPAGDEKDLKVAK